MKKKLIIGGLILLVAVGYLGYLGYRSSAAYYYSPTQLLDKGSAVFNKVVRVDGSVAPGSLQQKAGDLNIKFNVSDGADTVPVVYQGILPDTFQEGNPVVVEGKLDASGVFQATTLMVKCPSKYQPTVTAPSTNGTK